MSFDLPFSLSLQNLFSGSLLDPVMVFITRLGNFGLFWIVLSGILLIIRKTRGIGFACFTALITDSLLVELIKNLVKRARPFQVHALSILINAPSGYSFPSAHASIAFAVATTYFILGNEGINRKLRWVVLVIATLIAISRVYLFVHFLTDILAGALLGILVGFAVSRVYKKVKAD